MVRKFLRSAAFVILMAPAAVSMAAQHEGHVMPGMPQAGAAGASPELVAACVQSQQQVMVAADATNRRLDVARQSNQPAAMRAAMDDLQGVLSSMRTQLASCAQLQAAAAPGAGGMAGHDMSTMTNAGGAPGTPVVNPGSTTPAPGGAGPAASAPRPTMVMVQTAFDPTKLTCSPKIDPKAAATTTYQGKTYYFCSAKERDEFLTDPAMSLGMMPPKQ